MIPKTKPLMVAAILFGCSAHAQTTPPPPKSVPQAQAPLPSPQSEYPPHPVKASPQAQPPAASPQIEYPGTSYSQYSGTTFAQYEQYPSAMAYESVQPAYVLPSTPYWSRTYAQYPYMPGYVQSVWTGGYGAPYGGIAAYSYPVRRHMWYRFNSGCW